jgi:hypothetical protein
MASQNEKGGRPDPYAEGKGRTDEVDQSKGFFPPGVPHPEGAEIRTPGSIGGGSYDESGRGGVDVSVGQSTSTGGLVDRLPATGAMGGEAPEGERAEDKEPKGSLPPHEAGEKK